MFEVKVTVEAPALTEAINNLAGAMAGRHIDHVDTLTINRQGSTNIVQMPTPTTEEAPAVTEEAEPEPVETVEPAPAPVEEVKSYTLEEISNAGAALVDQGKMAQLCDLLTKYSVQAITQLDPGTYPAFVADLKALGAPI